MSNEGLVSPINALLDILWDKEPEALSIIQDNDDAFKAFETLLWHLHAAAEAQSMIKARQNPALATPDQKRILSDKWLSIESEAHEAVALDYATADNINLYLQVMPEGVERGKLLASIFVAIKNLTGVEIGIAERAHFLEKYAALDGLPDDVLPSSGPTSKPS